MSSSRERTEGFDLGTALNGLRRHKLAILGIVVVVNAAVAVGLLLYGPHYTATASIIVEHRESRVLDGKAVASALPEWMPGDNSAMSTQVGVVKSPATISAVVQELKLEGDEEFASTTTKLSVALEKMIGPWLPASWAHSWRELLNAKAARPDETAAISGIQRRLSVEQAGVSHVILVSFTSRDPVKAARIANAIGRQYVEEELARKKQATDRAYDWAVDKTEQTAAELRTAETNVSEYMASTGLMATDASDRVDNGLVAQQLSNLQGDLAAARAALSASQAKVNQIREMQAHGGDYASLPGVASSPTILELRKQDVELARQEAKLSSSYGAQNRVLTEIVAQRTSVAAGIKQEITRILRNTENELEVATGRVEVLNSMIAAVGKQYAEAQQKSVKLRELNRIASARRTLYQSLLGRLSDISEQRALMEPDARLLSSAAVPSSPSSPKVGLLGAAGFLTSLALGISFAALREQRDRRIWVSEQISDEFGLPALAQVPSIRTLNRGTKVVAYLTAEPQSLYAEATRSILTGIQLQRGGENSALVIAVTSALPGEGKTTLAMSLAALTARRGQRAVVVDLDLQHPSLGLQLGRPVTAGVAEYITGQAGIDEIVQVHPSEPRLHVIPAQSGQDASDLLASTKLKALLDELRLRYEWIVLDLPPTIAMSDVQTVGSVADTALFVVRWGKTSRSAVARGLDVLGRTGIVITGVVLSQVDLNSQSSYAADGQFYRTYKSYFRA